MWLVRPATMTRRTERLSRLLRLWLTTMPSDFTTFPRLLRLSPERLCDFPARVCDYDRAADLPLRGRRLFLSRLIGGGFTGAAWALPGFRPDLKAGTFFSPLYCIAAMFAKNLDFLLYLRLTSKCKYAILYLQKGSKCKCTLKIKSPYISPCRPVK